MCKPTDDVLREVESHKLPEDKKAPSEPLWEKIATLGTVYLHISPKIRICYFIILVMTMSIITEFIKVPHFYALTGKKSTLNQMFVKLGWLWTFMLFGTYNVVSIVIHKKWIKKGTDFIVRLIVTTFFFYVWCTVTFPTVEKIVGQCIHDGKIYDYGKKECLKFEGHEYISFDISGHSFLLIYCMLIIMEESKEILYFLQLSRQLRGAPVVESEMSVSKKEAKSLKKLFKIMTPFIIVAYVAMLLISLLWDFMLIVTTIYYHSLAEKICGTLLAVFMWYVLYKWLFNIFHEKL